VTQVQDLLQWFEQTIADLRSGPGTEKRILTIKRGEALHHALRLSFAALSSEHRNVTQELVLQTEYARKISLLITTLGMLTSLALFAAVMLRSIIWSANVKKSTKN